VYRERAILLSWEYWDELVSTTVRAQPRRIFFLVGLKKEMKQFSDIL
jgi:hypothetical protein